MKRLPRKQKKQAKKIVAKKQAVKTCMAAMATASSMVQLAVISSTPGESIVSPSIKTLKAVQIAMETANAVKNIMSEPPNTWRDFVR